MGTVAADAKSLANMIDSQDRLLNTVRTGFMRPRASNLTCYNMERVFVICMYRGGDALVLCCLFYGLVPLLLCPCHEVDVAAVQGDK
jgi:hypothetical protein